MGVRNAEMWWEGDRKEIKPNVDEHAAQPSALSKAPLGPVWGV